MASSKLYTHTLECDGECGTSITLITRRPDDDTMSVAELLQWTTRDVKKGREVEVYCPFCQERAKRIVEGR